LPFSNIDIELLPRARLNCSSCLGLDSASRLPSASFSRMVNASLTASQCHTRRTVALSERAAQWAYACHLIRCYPLVRQQTIIVHLLHLPRLAVFSLTVFVSGVWLGGTYDNRGESKP